MKSFANFVTESESRTALAAEIEKFLSQHAKHAAGYDPADPDDDLKYNSPDGYELEAAATTLKHGGMLPRVPNSGWEGGGYAPYFDKKARAWHDDLLARTTLFVK